MIYSFGDFELDTRLLELRKEGVPRSLEPQVFDLLAYLVAHRDRVVPKDELLGKLWPDRFVSEAALTSRLKDARKAVGDSGSRQSWIKTHHGRGYRFVGEVHSSVEAPSGGGSANLVRPDKGSAESSGIRVEAPLTSYEPDPWFVGRQREVSILAGLLEQVKTGSRKTVFITGEAGAGKTTLVEHFLRKVAPARLLRGQCLEFRGAGEPYMPVFDAFERFSRGSEGELMVELLRKEAPAVLLQIPTLASIVPGVGDTPPSYSAGRMLREVAGTIEHLAAVSTLILLIEDLHWSDHSTLDLLDFLARRSERANLLTIATYRPADVKAGGHPLHAVAHELRVRSLAEVIALPALPEEDVREIVHLRFGDTAFAGPVATLLERRTSGNPLFVRNLLDSWILEKKIVFEAERWKLEVEPSELQTSVPESLQEVIEQQLSRATEIQQKVLEAASVAGREFAASAVAAPAGMSEDEVEAACEPLVREGRFLRAGGTESWPDGTFAQRYAFIHDLYVDVLYQRIPEARRARLHAILGRRLEEAWALRLVDRASELAHHFARGRDHERAVRYRKLAADQALARNAHHEAVDHLLAALDALDRLPESDAAPREELQIRSVLANSLVATRGFADQLLLENYRRAEVLARLLTDTTALSSILFGLAVMREYRGEFEESERLMKERLSLDAGARSELESHQLLACSYIHQGRHSESVDHADRAIASLDRTPREEIDLLLAVESHGWASGALFFLGYPDSALARCHNALALASSLRDEFAKATALIQSGFIRFYRREAGEVARLAEEGVALAREFRFPFHVGVGRILSGWERCVEARDSAGIDEIRAGIRICRSIGATLDDPLFLAILAEALLALDRPGEAAIALDEALTIVRSTRSFFYDAEIQRLRGVVCLKMDRDDCRASELFRSAVETARRQGAPMLALRSAVSLANLPGGDGAEGREVLQQLLPDLREGAGLAEIQQARAILSRAVSLP